MLSQHTTHLPISTSTAGTNQLLGIRVPPISTSDALLVKVERSMVTQQSAEYHFEPYTDPNGVDAIRVSFSDADGNKYSFDAAAGKIKVSTLPVTNSKLNGAIFRNFKKEVDGFSWNSYGAAFKLTVDGNLTVAKINQESYPSFKITGANAVTTSGQKFKQLQIEAKEVNFIDDCAVADLRVSVDSMLNKGLLNVEAAKISAFTITNSGKILAAKNAKIKAVHLDNRNGAVHAGDVLKLTTEHLQNEQGNLCGVKSAAIKISKSFTASAQSEIGVNDGATTINFTNKMEVAELGVIRGGQVRLINPPVVKGLGIIVANSEVLLSSPKEAVMMPQVDIQTPVLKLKTTNFQLADQAHCERTIVQTELAHPLVLTNEYNTAGTFEIHENGVTKDNISQKMSARFGKQEMYALEKMPNAQYETLLQATIQANRGFLFLTPQAKVRMNINAFDLDMHKCNHGMVALQGELNVYATEFDIERGGVAATAALVWAPRGFSLGRLVEDHTRRAFATFYANAHTRYAHNLGDDIVQNSFVFLGNNTHVYDGRHLLNMPIAISNGSYFDIKQATEVIGLLNNNGNLKTSTLAIDSTSGTSVWEACSVNVSGDCNLVGNFSLRRTTTVFEYTSTTYRQVEEYRHGVGAVRRTLTDRHPGCKVTFCNSDPAVLVIKGKLTGSSIITNEACIVDINAISPEAKIIPKNFEAGLYQQFISGDIQKWQALSTSLADYAFRRISPKYQRVMLTGIHTNPITHHYLLAYAMGFLAETNGFKDSQKVFVAVDSFVKPVVLSAQNAQLGGMLTAPGILITFSGKLALGSANPYYVNPKNPLQDLMNKGFNIHTAYMPDNIKEMVEQATKPKFHFMLRERFWFDEQGSQDFYRDIVEHIVIRNINGISAKPQPQAIFSLSPNYLIDRVREDCHEVLMRGYIYEDRPIDADFVKELHRNTTDYLKETNLSAQMLPQALALARKGANIKVPEKPMLFYHALINDQGLEVLSPYLYIPEAMIDEVRAQREGLFKTNVLCIFPKNLTPDEFVEIVKDRPVLRKFLLSFFKQNPQGKKYLHDSAIAVKSQAAAIVTVSNTDSMQDSVTLSGTILAKELAVVGNGKVVVNGQLKTRNTLLASLFDDVEIKPIIERIYHGSQENFDDVILSPALAHADDILQIFAGNDVLFTGGKTFSGLRTQIHALANILSVPAELLHQRVVHFYEKRKQGFIQDVYLEQSVTTHETSVGGSVEALAGVSAIVVGSQFNTKKVALLSVAGETKVVPAIEVREHQEQIISKNRTWHGTQRRSINSMTSATRSKGAEFNVQELLLQSSSLVEANGIHSTARLNEFNAPTVIIGLGRNGFAAQINASKSDLWWQQSRFIASNQIMYSESYIPGVIKIDARSIIVEAVRGRPPSWLPRLTDAAGIGVQDVLEYRWLTESHSREFNRVQGPGTGLVTLSAIAIAIATQGAASGLAASLLGTTTGAVAAGTVTSMMALAHSMITTGFISLAAQTGAAIMANRGDPKQAAKSLAGSNTVKSLVAAMVSAGVIHETCIALNLPVMADRRLMQHVQNNLAKASVNAVVNMVAYDQSAEQAMLNIAVNTVSQTIIDAKTSAPGTSAMTRKVAHTTMGGISGAAIGTGALVGALEGLIVAMVPDLVGSSHKHEESITGGIGDERFIGGGGEDLLQDDWDSSQGGRHGGATMFPNGLLNPTVGASNKAVGSQFNPRFRNVPTDDYAGKGTLEVAKLAVRGDRGAQQEMTRRMPRTAAYSNAVNAVNEEWRVGTRAMGGLQCAGGASQVAFSVAGGFLSSETVIGPVIAAGYATIGVDNAMTGARIFWTGRPEHTTLNQVLRSSGAGENTSMWLEMGLNLGPSLPGMAREAGNILQGPISKLYDLRNGTMLTQRGVAVTREFTAMHDFRSPVVFQFGAGRAEGVTFMHSGIKPPMDIKLRSPVVIKVDSHTGGSAGSIREKLSPNVQRSIQVMEDYLGADYKMLKNPAGDPIFINAANTKRIRFDVHNPHGELPHGHVEYFTGTRWKDHTGVHRITLKDVFEFIQNNSPKLDK